jgi:sugar/nucleoside kinase (ribokinase family)
MQRTNDVFVIGNVGMDTNVYLHAQEIDWTVEGNFTQNVDYIGHSGGFSSRGFARLGVGTGFIGPVGDDFIGQHILATFAGDGIDTRGVWLDPAGSDRTASIIFPDGRRKGFYSGRGHLAQRPDLDACRALMAGATLAHFSIPDWARHLLPVARQAGLVISCDIQDVVDPWDPYRRDFIEQADILFFSATNHPDPAPLIQGYLDGYPERIVIAGLGARGVALGSAAGIRFFPPVALDRPVMDTTGAGDSLAVGFLTSHLLWGHSLDESIHRGQIAARHCCALQGTSDGLITRAQMAELLAGIHPGE